MPSPAFNSYVLVRGTARVVRCSRAGAVPGLSSRQKSERLYTSALVAFVASWDAYINQIVRDFFDATSPIHASTSLLTHHLAANMANARLARFNTPNSENTRDLLLSTTGYDPWSDWTWNKASMSSLDVRNRLNEILKVRHSVAHGFAMPSYSWNTTSNGRTRIDAAIVDWTDRFFNFLVRETDKGMQRHIVASFGVQLAWY